MELGEKDVDVIMVDGSQEGAAKQQARDSDSGEVAGVGGRTFRAFGS